MKERDLPLPLPRQILTDSVYEAVKELVMDQHIEPATRVNIDQLARTLKVSQTPVREALARLEMDGLVIKEPLRGYSIAPTLDAAAFDQLYEVRMLLEPFAARRATEQRTEELITALRREDDSMRQTLDSRGAAVMLGYREYREFAWQDARFHEAIVNAAGNELLRDAVIRLRSHLHLYRLYYTTGIGAETLAEHEKIVEAIAGGKPSAAGTAMEQHIRRSRERLALGATEAKRAVRT